MAGSVAVIGGGAAGMTAAVFAARNGTSVVLLESGTSLGKKLLSTGNGRCNFTNRSMEVSCFRSRHPESVSSVLRRFGLAETLAFFRELGLHVSDRNGYLYPRSEQASAVREALEQAVKEAGVEILTGQKVISLERRNDGFHLVTSAGKKLHTASVILAAGGRAAPKTGSDGSGFALAERLGHTIFPTAPALVPLVLEDKPLCRNWKGTRARGRIELLADGTVLASDLGELQLTDYGVSGIPAFQVSRFAGLAFREERQVSVRLSFLPEFSGEEQRELQREFSRSGRSIRYFLIGLIPSRLAGAVCTRFGIKESMPCYALRGNQKKLLFGALTSWELPVTGTLDYDAAQTTAGGVDLSEVEPSTMESRCTPGLFLAGELLDVDGMCGGYNLQWAWSSGALAGMAAAGASGQMLSP